LHPFSYVAAKSVDEVNSTLAQHGARARCLVGGTDLLVQARAGRFELDAVVDIKPVPEANVLEFADGHLRMGAAVPCCGVYENAEVSQRYPGLIDAASLIGSIQIQSRASMGANLCNSSPSGDTICPLIVHKTECVIASGNGTRTVPAQEFCTGPGRNVLKDGEWLLELRIPVPPAHFGAAYERFIPRNEMDIAVCGAASALALDDSGNIKEARIALAAVGPIPVFAQAASDFLAGKAPTRENFEQAGEIASGAGSPIADMRGTVDQRKHLAKVLTRRTLEKAYERAKGAQ